MADPMLPKIDLTEIALTPEQRDLCAGIVAYSDTAGRLRKTIPRGKPQPTQYVWWIVSLFCTDRQHMPAWMRTPAAGRFIIDSPDPDRAMMETLHDAAMRIVLHTLTEEVLRCVLKN